jgi:two-component system sensor histidine kinase YesM
MRYGKRFDFDIHLDRKILNAGILKLTVQPIVENSIRHGFNGKEEPGLIVITAQRDGNDCLLEVYDDGVGIAEEKLKTLTQSINNPKVWKQGKAFGLWNVNQRLKLNYGDGYGITLASVQHVYTKVQVRIPFQRMGSV